MKEEREKRQRKTKKIEFHGKIKFGKESFTYDVRKKSLNFGPRLFSPCIQKHLEVLSWHSIFPSPRVISDFPRKR